MLTAGPLPPNPPAILARDDVADFLEQLRRHFRWVIVDSPPLASVTDALLLARHADMTVLVVQHDKVDKKVVKRSLGALRKATDNVLGAVLNAVDVKTRGHYYYYYQHHKDADRPTGQGAAGQDTPSRGGPRCDPRLLVLRPGRLALLALLARPPGLDPRSSWRLRSAEGGEGRSSAGAGLARLAYVEQPRRAGGGHGRSRGATRTAPCASATPCAPPPTPWPASSSPGCP